MTSSRTSEMMTTLVNAFAIITVMLGTGSEAQQVTSQFFPPQAQRFFQQGPSTSRQQPRELSGFGQQFQGFQQQQPSARPTTNFAFTQFRNPAFAGFHQQQFRVFGPGNSVTSVSRFPATSGATAAVPSARQVPAAAGVQPPFRQTGFATFPSTASLGFQGTTTPQQQQQQTRNLFSSQPAQQSVRQEPAASTNGRFPPLLPFPPIPASPQQQLTRTAGDEEQVVTSNNFGPSRPSSPRVQQQTVVFQQQQPQQRPSPAPVPTAAQPASLAPSSQAEAAVDSLHISLQAPEPHGSAQKGFTEETAGPFVELPVSAFGVNPADYDTGDEDGNNDVAFDGGSDNSAPSTSSGVQQQAQQQQQSQPQQPQQSQPQQQQEEREQKSNASSTPDPLLTEDGLIKGDAAVGGIDFRPSGVVPYTPIQNGWTKETAGDFVVLPLTEFFLEEVNNTGLPKKPKTEGDGQEPAPPVEQETTISAPAPTTPAPVDTSFQQGQQQAQVSSSSSVPTGRGLTLGARGVTNPVRVDTSGGRSFGAQDNFQTGQQFLTNVQRAQGRKVGGSAQANLPSQDFIDANGQPFFQQSLQGQQRFPQEGNLPSAGGISFIRPKPLPVVPFKPIENGYNELSAGKYVELPLSAFFLDEVTNKGSDVLAQERHKLAKLAAQKAAAGTTTEQLTIPSSKTPTTPPTTFFTGPLTSFTETNGGTDQPSTPEATRPSSTASVVRTTTVFGLSTESPTTTTTRTTTELPVETTTTVDDAILFDLKRRLENMENGVRATTFHPELHEDTSPSPDTESPPNRDPEEEADQAIVKELANLGTHVASEIAGFMSRNRLNKEVDASTQHPLFRRPTTGLIGRDEEATIFPDTTPSTVRFVTIIEPEFTPEIFTNAPTTTQQPTTEAQTTFRVPASVRTTFPAETFEPESTTSSPSTVHVGRPAFSSSGFAGPTRFGQNRPLLRFRTTTEPTTTLSQQLPDETTFQPEVTQFVGQPDAKSASVEETVTPSVLPEIPNTRVEQDGNFLSASVSSTELPRPSSNFDVQPELIAANVPTTAAAPEIDLRANEVDTKEPHLDPSTFDSKSAAVVPVETTTTQQRTTTIASRTTSKSPTEADRTPDENDEGKEDPIVFPSFKEALERSRERLRKINPALAPEPKVFTAEKTTADWRANVISKSSDAESSSPGGQVKATGINFAKLDDDDRQDDTEEKPAPSLASTSGTTSSTEGSSAFIPEVSTEPPKRRWRPGVRTVVKVRKLGDGSLRNRTGSPVVGRFFTKPASTSLIVGDDEAVEASTKRAPFKPLSALATTEQNSSPDTPSSTPESTSSTSRPGVRGRVIPGSTRSSLRDFFAARNRQRGSVASAAPITTRRLPVGLTRRTQPSAAPPATDEQQETEQPTEN